VALSQDSLSLALAEPSGLVRVCNPWDGSHKYTTDLRNGEGSIEWIDFGYTKFGTPCLFSIISTKPWTEASSKDSSEVVVQNPQTGYVIARVTLNALWHRSHAALDPDCKRLLVVQHGELQLWDGEKLAFLWPVFVSKSDPCCFAIAWAPDGRTFAMATNDAVILYDPTIEAQIGRISLPSDIFSRLCYVSETTLAYIDSRSLKLLRVTSTSSEAACVSKHKQALKPIVMLNPATSGQLAISKEEEDDEILVTAIDNTLCRLHIPGSYASRSRVFSPDRRYAFVDPSGLINIWNINSGRCLHQLRGHVNDSQSSNLVLEFAPSGQLVSANHDDGRIRIWNPTTGDCLLSFISQSCQYGVNMATSADGRIAIVPSSEQALYCWDIGRGGGGKTEWTLSKRVFCLSFNSNGLLALLWSPRGARSYLSILDLNLGICRMTYRLPWNTPYTRFHTDTVSRVDVGHGVLDLTLDRPTEAEEGAAEERFRVHDRNDQPPVWNQQFLKFTPTETEAWLMRGSKKVLWLPKSTGFIVRLTPNFDTGVSMVTMTYNSHALIFHVRAS
jgi:WD40 repeat protein